MKKNSTRIIKFYSIFAALSVGCINMISGYLSYQVFMGTRPKQDVKLKPLTSQVSENNNPSADLTKNTGTRQSTNYTATTPQGIQNIRKTGSEILVGQPAIPSSIILNSDGSTTYLWCESRNPDLEDGVCEAILSIASNPSPSNPHLSEKVLTSLSLLPSNSTIKMDESSWIKYSQTSGEMTIIMHTNAYGDIKLKVFLDKINENWVVSDGHIT